MWSCRSYCFLRKKVFIAWSRIFDFFSNEPDNKSYSGFPSLGPLTHHFFPVAILWLNYWLYYDFVLWAKSGPCFSSSRLKRACFVLPSLFSFFSPFLDSFFSLLLFLFFPLSILLNLRQEGFGLNATAASRFIINFESTTTTIDNHWVTCWCYSWRWTITDNLKEGDKCAKRTGRS